jgi:molybdate transport system substrate-binding protein
MAGMKGCVWLFMAMVLSLTLFLTGCGGGQHEAEGESAEVTVLAASSLTEAFGELEEVFSKRNGGAAVHLSFASSSALLAQIEQGAPADVFASADEAKMETAVQKGLVAGPEEFARNRPVVVVPRNNPAGIQEFRDLSKSGTKLTLAEDGVPIAEYAKEILGKADAEYGEYFGRSVLDNMTSREVDVKASANRVALGEADGTFVYATDVKSSIRDKVEVIEIPEELNVVATYPIVVTKEARSPDLAQKWVDLVLSDEGQEVMKKYGFEPVGRS